MTAPTPLPSAERVLKDAALEVPEAKRADALFYAESLFNEFFARATRTPDPGFTTREKRFLAARMAANAMRENFLPQCKEPAMADKSIHIAPYTIEVSPQRRHGYFEHDTWGEERGGGLDFDLAADGTLTLIDMDGPCGALPKKVAKALRDWGINVPEQFE